MICLFVFGHFISIQSYPALFCSCRSGLSLYCKARVCDKIILINGMQSGTVLHIALLKKLSSHYPSGQLCSRFYQFKRSSPAKSSSRSPCAFQRPSFEKYDCSRKLFLYQKSQKPRRNRMDKKFSRVLQNWQPNESVTAWNVDNQQQVSYTEKLKRDKYDFFPHLLECPQKKENARIRFQKSRSQKAVLNVSKVLNLMVDDAKTEKNTIQFRECKFNSAIHARAEEKENQMQLQPLPATIKMKNRRVRSKDRSITTSPLSRRLKNSII